MALKSQNLTRFRPQGLMTDCILGDRLRVRGGYCSWSLIYASDYYSQTKFPRLTFATLAISAKREIICRRQTYLSRVFPLKQHIFVRGNSPSENAKANTDAATINTNFMLDFEQKIPHCYHNQFFVTKDM